MFKTLLACTDGSTHGVTACRYALLLAKACQADVSALHVLDVRLIEGPFIADMVGALGVGGYYAGVPRLQELLTAKGQAVAGAFAALAREVGLKATCEVTSGHPRHVILERARGADLLVAGRRGENEQFGGEWIGSIAEGIIRHSRCPCFVTAGQYAPITHVMAACGGGLLSDSVARQAALLAKALSARLTLVTVTNKQLPMAKAQEIAVKAGQAATAAGGMPQSRVLTGKPDESLLEAIVAEKADCIVMGTHAHGRIRELFVGCTTLRVLANSAIPALLVNQKA